MRYRSHAMVDDINKLRCLALAGSDSERPLVPIRSDAVEIIEVQKTTVVMFVRIPCVVQIPE